MRNSEQLRAANALARVSELTGEPDGFKKRYRAYVDRLGPTILMNGLGQALATERAAAGPNPGDDQTRAHDELDASRLRRLYQKRAHDELYTSLQRWLCRDGGIYPPGQDLLEALMGNDEAHYLHAQAEALAWLEWHKKFCRASLPKGEED